MDYQEAIEKLQYIKRSHIPDWSNKKDEYYPLHEAINSAISAMHKLQSYKQIGTLEDLIKLKERELSGVELAKIACNLNLLEKYKQFGTLEEVREAVEKQKAKKPNNVGTEGYRYTDTYRCPTCGGNFSGTGIANYCYHCGQRLDWE